MTHFRFLGKEKARCTNQVILTLFDSSHKMSFEVAFKKLAENDVNFFSGLNNHNNLFVDSPMSRRVMI